MIILCCCFTCWFWRRLAEVASLEDCLEDVHLHRLLSRLYGVGSNCDNGEEISLSGNPFLTEQAYL
jgi:hypothetical protein